MIMYICEGVIDFGNTTMYTGSNSRGKWYLSGLSGDPNILLQRMTEGWRAGGGVEFCKK